MADSKISALTAVVTPASTDEFAVNQGGTSKKMTRAQVHALESGEVLLLDDGLIGAPGLAFKADPDTGIYRSGNNAFRLVTNGLTRVTLDNSSFKGVSTSYFQIDVGSAASATNPAYAFSGDGDSGLGQQAADNPCIVAGGLEAARFEDPADLTATETSLWVYDLDGTAIKQVTVGADDSGGAGFKVLRIAN